jgi:hypothetical protein
MSAAPQAEAVRQALADQACRDLVLRAAWLNDAGDHEHFAALFAENATLQRPQGEALTGRASIVAAYQQRPAHRLTRHLICGTHITARSPHSVEAVSQVLLWVGDARHEAGAYGRPAQQQVLGAFEDRFALGPAGCWLIARRVASFSLHAPVAP